MKGKSHILCLVLHHFIIRTGRGGRNETNHGAPETVVLGAVNYMLGETVRVLLIMNNMYGG